MPPLPRLQGLDAFLGASNGDAIKGLGDALKAFGVPDSELLDLDKLRQEVRLHLAAAVSIMMPVRSTCTYTGSAWASCSFQHAGAPPGRPVCTE